MDEWNYERENRPDETGQVRTVVTQSASVAEQYRIAKASINSASMHSACAFHTNSGIRYFAATKLARVHTGVPFFFPSLFSYLFSFFFSVDVAEGLRVLNF